MLRENVNNRSTAELEAENSKKAPVEYTLNNVKHLTRKSREITSSNEKARQSKHMCGSFGAQPCTCSYPDHPNVTQFELNADEITKNASSLNDTGPVNCDDLKSMGYKLPGFHLVRFKPKRVKAIYCEFNQTTEKLSNQFKTTTSTILKKIDSGGSPGMVKFCNSIASNSCTFLYSDHPDTPLLNQKRNKTASNNNSCENCVLGPTNCEDLRLIGHKLKGFYVIRLNALKVKIVFCDFTQMMGNANQVKRAKRATLKQNGTSITSKNVTRVCQGFGSQPCSCYFSNFRDILQFEMSNDEITMNAIHKNGSGPETCDEIRKIGHKLDGFYMLRFNSTLIKTSYCKFNRTKRRKDKTKKDKNELTTLKPTTSTLLGISNCNFHKLLHTYSWYFFYYRN